MALLTGEPVAFCELPDCFRPAERNGLCSIHRKRKRLGKVIAKPVRERLTRYERVLAAGVDHLDAVDRRKAMRAPQEILHLEAVAALREHLDNGDADSDYHRTRVRLREAARIWTANIGEWSLRELRAELLRLTTEIERRGLHRCRQCHIARRGRS